MKKKLIISGVSAITPFILSAQSEQPNIIFFLVDDMGWQETSVAFYKERTWLNNNYNTPNMERLELQGVKFTQAYACPLSSPSRISLMTGQNAARHKVTNWTLFKDQSPDRYSKNKEVLVPEWNVNGMSMAPGVEHALYVSETLPSILRKAGYKTIHVGKAHWGAIGTPGEDPLNLGFDVNIAGHAAGGPGSYYGKNNFSAAFRNGGPEWDVPGLEKYHGKDINLTEALTLEATHEMVKAVDEKRPFYLYMSHYAIHAPWEEDNRFVEKYKQMGLTDFEAVYASMLESMDKSLGDLMQHVRRLGIEKNTIIIFMSDNGQPHQVKTYPPLRGHKITPYEGGIRVPMLVKVPGMTKPGSECNVPVIIEDIYPTILSLASATKFAENMEIVDGRDISPLLQGKKSMDKNRAFFWHYPHIYDVTPYSIIRKGDWKLIWHYADQRAELFNLKYDIGEKNNLADKEPDKAQALRKELREYLESVNAPIPRKKSTNEPFRLP